MMRGWCPGRRRREAFEIERTYASVVRELRHHTSRQLALLITWQQRDPSVKRRHQQALVDIDTQAARAVLQERHAFDMWNDDRRTPDAAPDQLR